MKAVVLTKFGPPDVLQLQDVETPTPKEDEVLIKIHASTVALGDCEIRGLKVPLAIKLPLSIYLGRIRTRPVILGQELAGEIEAVGSAVTRFKKGDQVAAWSGIRMSANAEYICLREGGVLARKPANMSFSEAATLPVGGLEAAYFIRMGRLRPGEKILIIGAGGSIGSYAVQLARCFGAEVTGVDSAGKLDWMRALGADHVIDYTREDYTRDGATYDVIFDVVGKSSYARSIRMLAPNGRYLISNPRRSHRAGMRLTPPGEGKQVFPWESRPVSEILDDFAFLTELIEAGKIKAAVGKCYPLEQTAEAHRYVESGQKKGSVVIMVDHNG